MGALGAFGVGRVILLNDGLQPVFGFDIAAPGPGLDLLAFPLGALVGQNAFGVINAVFGQVAFIDATLDAVFKGWAAFLLDGIPAVEKDVGVADQPALMLADATQLSGVRRCGQADMNGVKMAERGPVGVVDRAVAFIGDHQIEVAMPETVAAELGCDGVERADDDLTLRDCACRHKE